MAENRYRFLDRVDTPEDLKKLSPPELKGLCIDIRNFLIEAVSKTGGHLGAGLGAVELAVACHYVFNTPDDKLVWDVGHQAYPHKILTGRKGIFHTIRQYKGVSGFLRRAESEYDTFGAGHASTAISAALGMVAARELRGEDYRVVAIVGDGAMTGGLAYEGMNNAGLMKKDLIVILNDNNMSIAPNVWAISNYFTQLISNPSYNRVKSHIYQLTEKLDVLGDRIRKVASELKRGIKVIITPECFLRLWVSLLICEWSQRCEARPVAPGRERLPRSDSRPCHYTEGKGIQAGRKGYSTSSWRDTV